MYVPSLTSRPNINFKKPSITKKSFIKYIDFELKNIDFKDRELTVSIVAYNERDLVVNLVNKIVKMNNENVGVILVDNGLEDDIREKLTTLPIHYIKAKENLGASLGRNLVASQSTTPTMAILDADAVIEDSYLEDCLAAFNDNKSIVCIRGKVVPLSEDSRKPAIYDLGNNIFPHYPTTEGISVWRTNDFKKVGGFEEDLFSGEGVVLCHRMIEYYNYNYEQFIYYPRLRLHHDYNSGLAQLANKEMRNLINSHNIDLFYPQLTAMKRHFNELSKKLQTHQPNTDSLKIARTVKNTRTKFKKELEDEAVRTVTRRWSSPDAPVKGKKYRFAVILPCYSLGEYLEEAVRSVMRQTIDHLQIIIVDDVSPDEYTKKILRSLETHVKVIYRDKNGGASAARNTGIAAASAEYILCLDADDTISDTYLEEAYNQFLAEPEASIISCQVEMKGGRNGLWKPHDRVTIPEALLTSPIPNASCYRREIWDKVGGYDEKMRGYEDWEYWIHSLKLGAKIRVIPRPHYFYLNRPDSKVKTSNKNAAKIVEYIVTKHQDLYKENMIYVVANTHKMYVEQRIPFMSCRANRRRDINSYTFVLRAPLKIARKAKTAYTIALIQRNPEELQHRVKLNINKLAKKIKGI